MLPHDDIRIQLEDVHTRARHNHELRPRVDGGAQEAQEYRGGKRRYGVRLESSSLKLTDSFRLAKEAAPFLHRAQLWWHYSRSRRLVATPCLRNAKQQHSA
jgi:hypothetical protein